MFPGLKLLFKILIDRLDVWLFQKLVMFVDCSAPWVNDQLTS
jgi:hypothetical protein